MNCFEQRGSERKFKPGTVKHYTPPKRGVRRGKSRLNFGLSPMMVPIKPRADHNSRTPPIWSVVRPVIVWIRIVTRTFVCDGRRRRGFLVHIEINPLRDAVGVGPTAASAIGANLSVLVGRQREGLDHVFEGTEVMKSSIPVTKDFEMHWGVADVIAVSFNSGARFGGFDQNVVSDCAVRTAFDAGRDCLTPSQQAGKSWKTKKDEKLRFHITNFESFYRRNCPNGRIP